MPLESVLLSAGLPGAILAWFMYRAEGKWDDLIENQNRLEAAMNRMVRAQMLELIARPDTPDSVRQLAQDLSRETDEAEKERLARAQSRRGRLSRLPLAPSQ